MTIERMTVAAPSRPELQRTELGPIINHMALEIIDRADAIWQPEQSSGRLLDGDTQLGLADLADFEDSVLWEVDGTISKYIIDAGPELVEHVEGLMRQEFVTGGALTFQRTLKDLLSEGLSSGVAMPLHAYIRASQICYSGLQSIEHEFDPDHFIETLRAKSFQATLLRAAFTRNGLYGAGSTVFGFMNNPFSEIEDKTDMPAFEPSGNGGYRLTESTRQCLESELKMANFDDAFDASNGCPVRHSNYHRLGQTALSYARMSHTPVEDLQNQPCSSIVRGCLFLANCMERLVEYREQASVLAAGYQ